MKVSVAILDTLTGFADTLNMTPVLEKDNVFLETLCSLLGNSSLQLPAAECLLVLLSRRVSGSRVLPINVWHPKNGAWQTACSIWSGICSSCCKMCNLSLTDWYPIRFAIDMMEASTWQFGLMRKCLHSSCRAYVCLIFLVADSWMKPGKIQNRNNQKSENI